MKKDSKWLLETPDGTAQRFLWKPIKGNKFQLYGRLGPTGKLDALKPTFIWDTNIADVKTKEPRSLAICDKSEFEELSNEEVFALIL